MGLTIKGKLVKILNPESGIARAGNSWKKQEFVVETSDQFPKKICFTLFNDKVALLKDMSEGDDLDVSFDIESREYNNKWFHNINAWKIERIGQQSGDNNLPPLRDEDVPPEPTDDQTNDLPF